MVEIVQEATIVDRLLDLLRVAVLIALSAAVALASIRDKKKEPERRRINRP